MLSISGYIFVNTYSMPFSFIKNHLIHYTVSFLTSLALAAPLYAGKNGPSDASEEEVAAPLKRPSPTQFLHADHLTSSQDHTNFLIHALNDATDSVMISSYSISPAQLFGESIDKAIIRASSRGVRVYVYYQNLPRLSREDYRRLQKMIVYCARFEENENHAKCVAQDKTKVAIGSYNWLSETDERSINRSWVVSGLLAKGLINDVWQGIRFYESLKHDNARGINSFLEDNDAFSTGAYQFHPGEFLYTLRTPEAHSLLLEDEVFAKAQKEIVICSPFIRLAKLKQTISESRLQQLEKRGVQTHLFTLYSPCNHTPMEKGGIFDYLKEISRQYPHFSYSTHGNLHAKTIIADDLLCEGSFNLLSAIGDIDHPANNFEMSVAIRGNTAAPFIASFHESFLAQQTIPFESPSSVSREDGVSTPATRTQKRSRMETPTHTLPETLKRKHTPDIRIFSGESFNIRGFCARLEGEYIRNSMGKIAYFTSPEEARTIAEKVWISE